MNEQLILKLAEQASMDFSDFEQDTVDLDELKKFAELIVKECANMAESFHHHQYDFTGNLELHEFIKEHFGVEE
jgi:DNA-binding transcriptional MocR family regulator